MVLLRKRNGGGGRADAASPRWGGLPRMSSSSPSRVDTVQDQRKFQSYRELGDPCKLMTALGGALGTLLINQVGIEEGLQSLCEGGAPPRFLVIDDGWQEIDNEFKELDEDLLEMFAERLVDLKV